MSKRKDTTIYVVVVVDSSPNASFDMQVKKMAKVRGRRESMHRSVANMYD